MLSKPIPKKWSPGIFKVDLLSTEGGTAGRAAGDVLCLSSEKMVLNIRSIGRLDVFAR